MQVFVPVSHCKDTHNLDKTNNFFKEDEEKGDQASDLLCPKLSELLYKNPQISPSNPNQNTEQHCGFDQQAAEHGRKDVLLAEARSVNQLLEEGEDEHAGSPSERKEQHSSMRHLMRLFFKGGVEFRQGQLIGVVLIP